MKKTECSVGGESLTNDSEQRNFFHLKLHPALAERLNQLGSFLHFSLEKLIERLFIIELSWIKTDFECGDNHEFANLLGVADYNTKTNGVSSERGGNNKKKAVTTVTLNSNIIHEIATAIEWNEWNPTSFILRAVIHRLNKIEHSIKHSEYDFLSEFHDLSAITGALTPLSNEREGR